MKEVSRIYKGVDKEKTLFGLKGVFIAFFIGIFMGTMLVYMVLSSFFPAYICIVVAAIFLVVLLGFLLRMNKKYGVHMIDILSNRSTGVFYFTRNGRRFKNK